MGIFSCPCVCPAGVCGGEQELVKIFTAWQILASLENTGKPGKYWQAWKILGAVLGDILPLG